MKKQPPRKYFIDKPALIAIGGKIREIRTQKNISQEMLANECDIDYSQINRMELGKVNFSISNFLKVAAKLGVDAKDLLP